MECCVDLPVPKQITTKPLPCIFCLTSERSKSVQAGLEQPSAYCAVSPERLWQIFLHIYKKKQSTIIYIQYKKLRVFEFLT